MKVAIIGASGFIGAAILNEALSRGHQVTAIVRNPEKIDLVNPQLTIKQGDVTNEASVAELVAGNDAVISAYNSHESATYVKAIQAILNGVRKAGIKRFLAVSGAGSLEVAPGLQLLDTPEFPAAWKGGATATRDAFQVIKQAGDLEWTVLSPAAMIAPGERTGTFRLGKDQLLTDDKGESKISTADYAVALVDELEKPQHIQQRFTVAY
ncbi:NAD(P)-dependent oxidoreductase [Chitinophaga nivalis]|uniref:NAD(P)-dependent oxidoreductase n=1 Tax=Chitinophaga nivalis TaxID=2991709 RepID=A0ABT3IPY5_9BACT|nr:NAD(P)-dependent oxidoreductase [Chitinophaga nivalis]MCW3464348.1 NAD(P)-dependent oxidoreductase [Chitinophaga nivalis]MCW3485961.1 NAD(P)-dependent oxidoreductase [Chitinophaga nivalis]